MKGYYFVRNGSKERKRTDRMKKTGRKLFGEYEDESAVIEQIFLKANMRPHGKKPTLQDIAGRMNRDGYKTQKGRPWYPIAISRILKRGQAFYINKKTRPKKFQVKREGLPANKHLSDEQVNMCLDVLGDENRLLFHIMFQAGLRAAEVCDLQVRDINIYQGKSEIEIRKGKGKKPRTVTIATPLREMLFELLPTDSMRSKRSKKCGFRPIFINHRGRAMKYKTLYDRIVEIGNQAEIIVQSKAGVLHPHMLRHTFAINLLRISKDLECLREQLGHASLQTTQIYVKTLPEDKLKQMELFAERFKR